MSLKQRRAVLQSLPTSTPVMPGTALFAVVESIIKQHRRYGEKTARGVTAFVKRPHPSYKTMGLYIIDGAGDHVDISLIKGYTPARKAREVTVEDRGRLVSAFRAAVHRQVIDFKKSYHSEGVDTLVAGTRTDCATCFTPLPWYDTHVDHVKKFRDIMSEFLTSHGRPSRETVDDGDSGRAFHTDDASYMTSWQEYHRSNAILRFTCASCNLKMR